MPELRQVADGVHLLSVFPRHGVNCYVMGDVLVDTTYQGTGKKVLAAVRDRGITAIALTHAHGDHAGGAVLLKRELGVPLWAGARDVEATEAGVPAGAPALMAKAGSWPAVPVDRALHEGDEVAGFRVIDTPGHSPGHVSYWREADRTLVCGDVVFNRTLFSARYGIRHPPPLFTPDQDENRRSQRVIADLGAETVLVGHGPPLTGAELRRFVDAQR